MGNENVSPIGEKEEIARWETRSGKHWVTLYRQTTWGRVGHGYNSPDGSGWFGYVTEEEAFAEMVERIGTGMFQPGKTPVSRVK